MDKQMTMSALSDELAQVRTKKKEFLAQIERIVPWKEWLTANMGNPPDVLLQWLSAFPIADSNCSLTRVTSMGSQPAQIERCTMGRLAG